MKRALIFLVFVFLFTPLYSVAQVNFPAPAKQKAGAPAKKTQPAQKKGSKGRKAPAPKFGLDRKGEFQAGLGAGMVFHNPAFDLRLDTEYFFTNNVSAGVDFDMVFQNSTVFAFDAYGRYTFDFLSNRRFAPYASVGIGALVNTNGAGGMDILLPNLGCRYEAVSKRLFIGPDLGVHIVTDFGDTTWDVSLLFVNALYRF